jgi:hypothetical protein
MVEGGNSPISLHAAATLACAACQPRQAAPPPPWRLFHRGGHAIGSVDTSRIGGDHGEYDVRVRVDYENADRLPWDSTRTFQRVDLITRVNCVENIARDSAMDMLDSAGVRVEGVLAPGAARPFEEHPIGTWLYPPLCEYLRTSNP